MTKIMDKAKAQVRAEYGVHTFSTMEACKSLGISLSTMRKWIAKGRAEPDYRITLGDREVFLWKGTTINSLRNNSLVITEVPHDGRRKRRR